MSSVCNITERTCPMCGRNFIPAPLHVYMERYTRVAYCSYHCYNHRNDNKKAKTKTVEKCDCSGEVIETYESARIAAERNNMDAQFVRDACRSGKFYKGYLWRYKNDLP